MPSGQNRSSLVTLLRWLSKLLPGDYLKTTFYLNVIAKPRKALRLFVNSFYRMDHVYEVLKEVKNKYEGKFSILEFCTANGYSFTKMLYATKYLHMDNIITVHAFDPSRDCQHLLIPKIEDLHRQTGKKGNFEVIIKNWNNIVVKTTKTTKSIKVTSKKLLQISS
ncbi:MAG: hypothetical protein BRC45_10475 [Cyanobacteria bacterium QS_5_48_63]|nr:MAG: hypothetical protein BRC45_10475 [Cyanobacteria bacterium QS_5_48_63]